MTHHGRLVVAVALAGAVVVVRTPAPARAAQQPQQTFRATTDVVLVDVSVRDGGRPVTGLTADDFTLTDNGVRQRIEAVETTAVPIDLTLVVDLSGNPRRPVEPPVSRATVVAGIAENVDQIARLLRPDDRVRLLAVDQSVQQLWPMRPAPAQAPIARVEFDGPASLYDTLATALIQSVEPARRHIVIAATRGVDTISSVGGGAIETIARQSDALFHVVIDETELDNSTARGGFQCAFMGFCWPTRRFWVPHQRPMIRRMPSGDDPAVSALTPDGQAVSAAAEATGGALHLTSGLSVPSLAGTFRRVFDDFRAGYMLRYTPQDVRREGWHEIEVRVPASRSYTVRARKGYGVEEVPPAPETAPVPEVPRTLAELATAYERGMYQAVVTGLRQVSDPVRLIRDFEEAGNPWPAAPRREAALALELAETGAFATRAATRKAAHDLMARFTRLVRHPLEPDVFERYWHFAALTLAEGAVRPDEAEPFVERALARFPGEPRFILSRAIVADQRWREMEPRGPAGSRPAEPTTEHIEQVRSRYAAAAVLPDVGVEARIRLAWFLHRLGEHDEALVHLVEVGSQPIADAALRYLQALLYGHVLLSRDRRDEAAHAYRAALAVAPAAQSARVALMNTLLASGDRAGAAALAEEVEIETSTAIDPWWIYWQGQYRFFPAAMARVRELSR
jgi:VWFA-related protein